MIVGALLGADEFGFRDRPADRGRLHHDAQVPPQHVPVASRGTRCCGSASRDSPSVINFLFYIAEEVRQLLAEMGYTRPATWSASRNCW